MNKNIEKLAKQFSAENCFANFGYALLKLDIHGIKGTNCCITFDYPITAISGYNGAGKSTIAQIALCMYRAQEGDDAKSRNYLMNFFMKTLLDKTTYSDDAEIVAWYAAPPESEKDSQLSMFDEVRVQTFENTMHHSVDRWAGYKHQPSKKVYYFGMSFFIPYQEQNSNLLRDTKANIKNSKEINKTIVDIVAKILSINYSTIFQNDVQNEKRTENVISAEKEAAVYSENHMGCGEGRLLKLINVLENAPEKSLFVIEEPETALHQMAQYKLAEYFLDVSVRKHHQIIFTTHSPEIQKALPIQARKYIQRENNGKTSVVNSPSIAQIQNYLSGGHDRKMIIVTEDNIGKCYIMEILRAFSPTVFSNSEFFAMNLGFDEIKDFVKKSKNCGMHIFGIVDESRRADIANNILAFPEETAPEISIFSDEETSKNIQEEFLCETKSLVGDHHNYFATIAHATRNDIEYVQNRCIKLFVKNKGRSYFELILHQMAEWLSQCEK